MKQHLNLDSKFTRGTKTGTGIQTPPQLTLRKTTATVDSETKEEEPLERPMEAFRSLNPIRGPDWPTEPWVARGVPK